MLAVLGITSGSDSHGGSTIANGTASPDTSVETTATAPAASQTAPAAQRPRKARTTEITLERRRLADRVSIGVPRGWSAGISAGAVTVLSGNGRAEVQVYYEQGVRSEAQLAEDSKRFLLQRHEGARVYDGGRIDVGGTKAKIIRTTYPAGTESATVLVADGYSYLILARLGRPISREERRTAGAVATSFRPV